MQVFVSLCRCIYWGLACSSYWIETLVLKLREIVISTLLHHPFLFKKKTTRTQEVAAIACREALSLAEDLLLQIFVVGPDSKQVATDIQKGPKEALEKLSKKSS